MLITILTQVYRGIVSQSFRVILHLAQELMNDMANN